MLFNSLEFAIFLPIVFLLYWLIPARYIRGRNFVLLVASLVFYGWWDWRFLFLLLFSACVDFFIGIQLSHAKLPRTRKLFISLSLFVNLGALGFFKYYNFFLDSFNDVFSLFGNQISSSGLEIVLPVGISFYTFQTLSYSLDVYKKKLNPTRDPLAFFTYVSFFPQLVAGPIERATNLLPQFQEEKYFNYRASVDGARQMLWGFFKKIVIADTCAPIVDTIFDSPDSYSASTLILGGVLFAFQIYGDFSGYSDIAIGLSRWFGFNLMRNFAYPYFSRDIAEFWRRWHISLSTWFRDYLYIPLGGSKKGTLLNVRNIFIIFLVSGFWHGANWTFLVWGFLNALYFLPVFLSKKNRQFTEPPQSINGFPRLVDLGRMLSTFALTVVAWIFFRSESVGFAFQYLAGIFDMSVFTLPEFRPWVLFAFIGLLLIFEWKGRFEQHPLNILDKATLILRWAIYAVISYFILFYLQVHDQTSFIYFQF